MSNADISAFAGNLLGEKMSAIADRRVCFSALLSFYFYSFFDSLIVAHAKRCEKRTSPISFFCFYVVILFFFFASDVSLFRIRI